MAKLTFCQSELPLDADGSRRSMIIHTSGETIGPAVLGISSADMKLEVLRSAELMRQVAVHKTKEPGTRTTKEKTEEAEATGVLSPLFFHLGGDGSFVVAAIQPLPSSPPKELIFSFHCASFSIWIANKEDGQPADRFGQDYVRLSEILRRA